MKEMATASVIKVQQQSISLKSGSSDVQAAIVEYQASAASNGVELPLMQQILAFEVALQLGQDTQVTNAYHCRARPEHKLPRFESLVVI